MGRSDSRNRSSKRTQRDRDRRDRDHRESSGRDFRGSSRERSRRRSGESSRRNRSSIELAGLASGKDLTDFSKEFRRRSFDDASDGDDRDKGRLGRKRKKGS